MQIKPPIMLQPWLDYRRKRFWAWVVVLTYVLAGFLILPPILRHEITVEAQKALDRPVVIEKLRFNPLLLDVDLGGLKVAEANGVPIFSVDKLHIGFSLASLVHRAWEFDSIGLEGFKADIVRFNPTDNTIGRLMGKPGDPPKPAQPSAPTRLIIRHLMIVNARADFTDQMPATPFKTAIGPLNAEFSHVSTLLHDTGKQKLDIALEGGTKLEWIGESGISPLVSTGHVAVRGVNVPLLARYFADTVKVAAPTGSASAELDYHLQEQPDGVLATTVEHAGFVLSNLTLQEQGAASPFLIVPELRLSGAHLALPEQSAGADSLVVSGLEIAARRQKDGSIGPMPPQASPAPQPAEAGKPWAVALGKFEIKNAKARVDDLTLHEAAKIEIAPLDLAVDSLTNKPGADFPFTLSAGIASGGNLKLQGHFAIDPQIALDAKLSAADLKLAIAQPYMHEFARLAIEDGRLSSDSALTYRGREGLTLTGKGEIRSLRLRDEVEKLLLAAWDRLGVDGIQYRQSANLLKISQITLAAPYGLVRVAEDHSTNFSHIAVAAPAPAGKKAETSAKPIAVDVGKFVITQGAADYSDASLPLPFAAHVSNLRGGTGGFSSAVSSPTVVALRGQVGEFGQVKVDGSLPLFDFAKSTRIALHFHNVDFPELSPYTVKFAGRRIAKGRLDVDLDYKIDNGAMNGANHVVIRDIQLGEKVDVPGALDLPLDLAIALLTDDEGKIDVDLPVSGNLNDPRFDIGAVVTKVIGNFLGDLLSAPFRALAGLFGGEDDTFDHVDFDRGRAAIDPKEKDRLVHLGETLVKRPNLSLVVPGAYDPDADRLKLQLDVVDARMAKDLGEGSAMKQQRPYLENLFTQRIGREQLESVQNFFSHPLEGKPGATSLDEGSYVKELRVRVAQTEPMPSASLDALAQQRAKAVSDALTQQVPGLNPQRVTIGPNAEAEMSDNDTIPLKFSIESAQKSQ